MKKFEVYIPLCVTEIVEIMAEDEGDAISLVEEMYHNYEVSFDHDAEASGNWWADEIKD